MNSYMKLALIALGGLAAGVAVRSYARAKGYTWAA
jgi:hypothetical protein